MRLICFCGPKGSGKDTAAEHLLSINAEYQTPIFVQSNFADPVKRCVQQVFGLSDEELWDSKLKDTALLRWPYTTPRALTIQVAKLFRTFYGGAIWAHTWVGNLDTLSSPIVLCTDLRHVEELDAIESLGGKIVYINNPKVEAAMRKGRAEGDPEWTDISESLYDLLKSKAHCIIHNDGVSMIPLRAQVETVAHTLLGSWWQIHPRINPTSSTSNEGSTS